MLKRKEKILCHIKKNGFGIEIGPSHAPIAPKKEGYQVHILDHMNREQLVEKFRPHNVSLENIEEVDFVWNGEHYSQLTGKVKFYDWVIASHVLEHTPDFIGFLNECDSIMKDDAVISLAIPDKRYCFDHFRPATGISKIIDSHFRKDKMHTAGTVAEYFLNIVHMNGKIAWDCGSHGIYNFRHSLEEARSEIERVKNTKEYIDVHSWVFTPHSFRLMIHDLYCLGFIPFQELSFFSTVGCEFFVTLGRKGKGLAHSRIEMLKKIESEISSPSYLMAWLIFLKKYLTPLK